MNNNNDDNNKKNTLSRDSNKKLSPEELLKLQKKLDDNDEKIEDLIISQTRPKIFGQQDLKWDGIIKFFSNTWDNIIWSLYGKDVDESKRRERNREEKEERNKNSK